MRWLTKEVLTFENSTKLRKKVAETIMYVTRLYYLALDFSKTFGVRSLHGSFVNNLKDSIMHFRKMDEEYEIIKKQMEENQTDDGDKYDHNLNFLLQVELLSEHLTRGIVDAYVEILQYGSRFYQTFIDCVMADVADNRITNVEGFVKLLRNSMHFCRQELLMLRGKKLDIFRIFTWDKLSYNGGFQGRMLHVKTKCTDDYETMTNHLHTPELIAIYETLINVPTFNCRFYHVKKGDNIEDLAKTYSVDIAMLRLLNKLDVFAPRQPLPEHLWLIFPD